MEAALQAPRDKSFLRDWMLTVDHKKIGIMYGVTSLFFYLVGGLFALGVRTQLSSPFGTFVSSQTYNEFYTMHATIMVFLVIIPMLTGAFGNYLVPLQVGAREMAFPRMNALSYWLYLLGGFVFMTGMFFGMPDAGWTAYPPYSILSHGPGIDFWVMTVHLVSLASILGAMNIIVTVVKMRAPGMTLNRMPLFTWSMLVTAIIQLFATPALTGALTTLLLDRHFGTAFYNAAQGGDAMLYQHLFWFYSHPAVYIMILPGFGIISEVLPVFARKPIFGYHAIAYSSVAIGFLGFFVWAHHMFVAGMQMSAGIPFMITSLLIAVPTSVKVFDWLATIWGGSVEYAVPMLFASLGFIGSFIIGGFSGVIVASVPLDLSLHDTYFIVAHIHYVLFGGSVMTIMAGLFFWFPKVTGRMYNKKWGHTGFWVYFVGTQVTFFPMHLLGLAGMPRRYSTYAPEFHFWNQVSTIGAYILGVGTLLILGNLLFSAKYGRTVGSNPWQAQTLEWTVPSPPPEYNFDETPVVTGTPYQPYPYLGAVDDEPRTAREQTRDDQGNLVLVIWLGGSALTFAAASLVGSNVYLRNWRPSKFTLPDLARLQDLPYWSTLLLMVSGILCLVAGALFAKNRWPAFNGVLAVTVLSYAAVAGIDLRLFLWFTFTSVQMRTAYAPTALMELAVSVTSVVFLTVSGWYASYGNKARLNYFFPAAMNWWLYNALFGIVVLLIEHVITVRNFATWCGQHLT